MASPEVKEAWTFNPANFNIKKCLTGDGIQSPIYSQQPYSRHSFDTLSSVSDLELLSVSSCDNLFLTGDYHKPISCLTFTSSELDQLAETKSGSSSDMSLLTWSENPYFTSSMGSSASIYSAKPRKGLNYLPFGTQVNVMDKMWNETRKLTIQEWIEALDSPPYSDVSSYHAEPQSPTPTPGLTPVPREANKFRDFFQETNKFRDFFQETNKFRDFFQETNKFRDFFQRLTQKKTKVTEIEILPCKTDGVKKDDRTSSSRYGKTSKNFRSRVQKFFSRFVVCGKANQD